VQMSVTFYWREEGGGKREARESRLRKARGFVHIEEVEKSWES
jgi:hypothetical protein